MLAPQRTGKTILSDVKSIFACQASSSFTRFHIFSLNHFNVLCLKIKLFFCGFFFTRNRNYLPWFSMQTSAKSKIRFATSFCSMMCSLKSVDIKWRMHEIKHLSTWLTLSFPKIYFISVQNSVATITLILFITTCSPQWVKFRTQISTENTTFRYYISFILASLSCTDFARFQIFSIDYLSLNQKFNFLNFIYENTLPRFPLLSLGKHKLTKSRIRFVTSFLMYLWRVLVYLLYLSNVTRFYCVFDLFELVTTVTNETFVNTWFPK